MLSHYLGQVPGLEQHHAVVPVFPTRKARDNRTFMRHIQSKIELLRPLEGSSPSRVSSTGEILKVAETDVEGK